MKGTILEILKRKEKYIDRQLQEKKDIEFK